MNENAKNPNRNLAMADNHATCPHCLNRIRLQHEGDHWFCPTCKKPIYLYAADHGVLCPVMKPAQ